MRTASRINLESTLDSTTIIFSRQAQKSSMQTRRSSSDAEPHLSVCGGVSVWPAGSLRTPS